MVASSISANERDWTKYFFEQIFSSLLSSFCNNSTARLRCGECWTSARNSSDKIEMSGFFNPAASKMSMSLSEEMARETICRTACSSYSGDFAPPSLMLLASTARTS